ncbi:hypothetical protein ACFQAT_26210 [Undibacterium arcticum]|uniref:Uncharacterized protein n=1 Tax=Undibacterium arcticum TaxID=1762892 RepID=A0ABV7F922_9BURK
MKKINETRRCAIQLPAGISYEPVFVAIVQDDDAEVTVLGVEMQWRLFGTICDRAAFCEGGDLTVLHKVTSPEAYIKGWRAAFMEAIPVVRLPDGLTLDATIVTDYQCLPSYYEKEFGRLLEEHVSTLKDGHIRFSFDLSDPVEAKRYWDNLKFHNVKDTPSVTAAWTTLAVQQLDMAFGNLFAEEAGA